ncbi:hypothetical protein EWE75_21930 [Sphingomonas populi]|uniref:HTH tetR-type domain-containing protein n=1 Tax=Sphingomonas populi TaxID=2484750 RepID=A0A4Q6XKP2_9SPHN|nr:hypothetical protein [Sphingomonas populi]RZF60670.1 hypothetical protein EWE75_21930 [Sphingomonas populi]
MAKRSGADNELDQAEPRRKRGRPPKVGSAPKPARAPGRPGADDNTVGPESLVQMALDLLKEVPPGEITRASLARRANVDPGLIRYYFKNRDSLMRTAARSLTERLQVVAGAATNRAEMQPEQQLSARIRTLLEFKLTNPFYHRLMMEDVARSSDEASRKVYREIATAAVARYRDYLSRGEQAGTLRPVDPVFLYMAIIGMCDYFVIAEPVMAFLMEDGGSTADHAAAYADFMCDLMLNGLSPRNDIEPISGVAETR